MTFIVSTRGVENTESTEVKIGAGHVKIGKDFKNSGKVDIDTSANVDVEGNVSNDGKFSIRKFDKNLGIFGALILILGRISDVIGITNFIF